MEDMMTRALDVNENTERSRKSVDNQEPAPATPNRTDSDPYEPG
jgi:hypothetical protein